MTVMPQKYCSLAFMPCLDDFVVEPLPPPDTRSGLGGREPTQPHTLTQQMEPPYNPVPCLQANPPPSSPGSQPVYEFSFHPSGLIGFEWQGGEPPQPQAYEFLDQRPSLLTAVPMRPPTPPMTPVAYQTPRLDQALLAYFSSSQPVHQDLNHPFNATGEDWHYQHPSTPHPYATEEFIMDHVWNTENTALYQQLVQPYQQAPPPFERAPLALPPGSQTAAPPRKRGWKPKYFPPRFANLEPDSVAARREKAYTTPTPKHTSPPEAARTNNAGTRDPPTQPKRAPPFSKPNVQSGPRPGTRVLREALYRRPPGDDWEQSFFLHSILDIYPLDLCRFGISYIAPGQPLTPPSAPKVETPVVEEGHLSRILSLDTRAYEEALLSQFSCAVERSPWLKVTLFSLPRNVSKDYFAHITVKVRTLLSNTKGADLYEAMKTLFHDSPATTIGKHYTIELIWTVFLLREILLTTDFGKMLDSQATLGGFEEFDPCSETFNFSALKVAVWRVLGSLDPDQDSKPLCEILTTIRVKSRFRVHCFRDHCRIDGLSLAAPVVTHRPEFQAQDLYRRRRHLTRADLRRNLSNALLSHFNGSTVTGLDFCFFYACFGPPA